MTPFFDGKARNYNKYNYDLISLSHEGKHKVRHDPSAYRMEVVKGYPGTY